MNTISQHQQFIWWLSICISQQFYGTVGTVGVKMGTQLSVTLFADYGVANM